jgi:putative ABC transport system permease protein
MLSSFRQRCAKPHLWLVSLIGVYGVVSQSVAQRIRMALGAQPRDVLTLLVRQGMIGALIGVAGGLAASFAFARLLSNLLYGVSATDPATFVAIPLLLTSVALLATVIPARRGMNVEPMTALRDE